jgi:hypothetical protein
MSRDFGGMKARLSAFNNASSAIVTSKGMEQIKAMSAADPLKFQGLLANAGRKVGAKMKAFLVSNCPIKGIMKRFMSMAVIDAQPGKIMVYLPEGLKFGEDSKGGNVYAAAGAFTYGAVRQPITKRAGVDQYFDKISGKHRFYVKNRGAFGDKAKRSIKAAILKGAALSPRQTKARNAIASGKVTVIPPKFPFFKTTPAQDGELQALWIECVKESLASAGIEVA